MEAKLALVDRICPNFFEKLKETHAYHLDSPEEDVVLLYHLGLGFHEINLFGHQEAENWFQNHLESVSAYRLRYLHLCLKILDTAFDEKKRWIIKNPDHSNYLLSFMDEFPQAKIIFTHRNPLNTVPSFATTLLFAQHVAVHSPFDPPNYVATPKGWGESIIRHCATSTFRLVESRKFLKENDPERDDKQIIDISYSELVSDPIATVKKIYEKFDLEFTEEHEQKMIEFLNQERSPTKKYSLEGYHISKYQVEAEFSHYINEFKAFIDKD